MKSKKKENKKLKNKRKPFFTCVKGFLKVFKRKPKVYSLCEQLPEQAIFISNHVGAMAPLTHELYLPRPFRCWGTYEMCGNYKSLYTYLSQIYFHQKKKINKTLSKVIAFIATPIMHGMYKGMGIMPTYPDARMKGTVDKSLTEIEKGNSILIFPEDSHDGYHNILTHYFSGFLTLAKYIYKKLKINIAIINMYYVKKKNALLIDKPVFYEEISKSGLKNEEIAQKFKDRANQMFEEFSNTGKIKLVEKFI